MFIQHVGSRQGAARLAIDGTFEAALRGLPAPGSTADEAALRYSALAGDGTAGAPTREAAMLMSAAESSLEEEDSTAALQKAEEALGICRSLGDLSGVADALRIVVRARYANGECEQALSVAAKELENFRSQGHRRGEATMLLSRAEVAAHDCNNVRREGAEVAVRSAQEARQIFREVGDQNMESATLTALSAVFLRGRNRQQQREECNRALAAGEEALALCRQLESPRGQAKALHAMAVATALQDREMLGDALQLARQALTLWRGLEDQRAEALELNAIARLQLQENQPEAVEAAQDAWSILRGVKIGRTREVAVLSTLVTAHLQRKEWDQAMRTIERKIANFQADEDAVGELLAMEVLFSVHQAQEDFREALRTCEKALVLVRSLPSRPRESLRVEAKMLHNMADAQLSLGEAGKAEEALEAALKIFKNIRDPDGQILAFCTLSYVSMNLREWRDAVRAAGDARICARQREDRLQEAVALLALCCANSAKGDLRRAGTAARDAQEIFHDDEHTQGEALALFLLAMVNLNSQEYEKAIATSRRSQILYREIGRRWDECNLVLLAAQAAFFQALEDAASNSGAKSNEVWQRALKMAEDALALNRKVGDDTQVGKCLLAVAQVYVMLKQSTDCQQFLDEAVALAQKAGNQTAEAWAKTINAQMYWALRQEDRCQEPAGQAAALFKKLGDSEGEALAEEMTRLISGAPAPDAAGAEGPAEGQYDGPTEEMLLATVNEVAFSLIGNESLAGDTPLMDAGLDSLASVEFQNTLAKEFQGVQLPSTLVFDFPTPKQISEFIFQGLREAHKQGKIKA